MLKSLTSRIKKGDGATHGYLILAEPSRGAEDLRSEFGIKLTNPDHYFFSGNSFDIKEARALKKIESKKSFSGGDRYFIIGAYSFTEEAQNALLKMLEEPQVGHYFFVITESEKNLLSTVRSRLIKIETKIEHKENSFLEKFLASGFAERLVIVQEFIKEYEDEDDVAELRAKTEGFLGEIERVLSGNLKTTKEFAEAGKEILKLKSYAHDPSCSSKLILEYLSAICPTIS